MKQKRELIGWGKHWEGTGLTEERRTTTTTTTTKRKIIISDRILTRHVIYL